MRIDDLDERLRVRREIDGNGCWVWLGTRTNDGYGLTSAGKGRQVLVHRLSYEREVGPIPEGLQLDHLCCNRACFNPDHLEPVTNRENVLRSPTSIPTINLAKTHCPQGHAYDAENTYVYHDTKRKSTGRRCRACKRKAPK